MDVVWGLWAPLVLSLVRRNVGHDVYGPCDLERLGSQHQVLCTMEVAMPTTTEGANGGGEERRGTRGADERRVERTVAIFIGEFFLKQSKACVSFCFVFRGGV